MMPRVGVHPDAAPDEFPAGGGSRGELDALPAGPPEGVRGLRPNGPHPRQVVADRLGVSISGLSRAGITEPLTTTQTVALKQEQPEWLRRERGTRAEAQREEARLRAERSGRRAQS